MKIELFITFFFLFTYSGLLAQNADVENANKIVSYLRDQKYDLITALVAPEAKERLNPPVFRQIREVLIKRNEAPNKFRDTAHTDSIRLLALKMLREMDAKKRRTEVETGIFKITSIRWGKIAKAEIPGTALNLIMGFSEKGQLLQFYLEPFKPLSATKYKDGSYADTTLSEQTQIFVQTGAFILPGMLTVPKGKKKFPIVVFVHGSGPGDRDEGLYALKPFRDIALGLAAKGIASVRYDKRTRIYRNAAAVPGTIATVREETTDDAASAIRLAANVPGADGKCIFLIGHSLGGMMTPAIVAENPVLAGAIILSGPSRSFSMSMEDQIRNNKQMGESYVKNGLKEIGMIAHADTIADQSLILLDQTAGFWADLKHYDQLEVVKKIEQPLLILQGERDYQVPFSDLSLWKAALTNKRNITTKSYSRINHFYAEGEGPARMEEYFVPGNVPDYVINDITGWILKTCNRKD